MLSYFQNKIYIQKNLQNSSDIKMNINSSEFPIITTVQDGQGHEGASGRGSGEAQRSLNNIIVILLYRKAIEI